LAESTFQSETAPLERVLLKHARDAFVSPIRIAEQWQSLAYLAEPDFDEACREYDRFAALLESLGVRLEWMTAEDTGLDSIYVRDAAVVSDSGPVLCRMGKGARRDEPTVQGRTLGALGLAGARVIEEPGTLEGGDVTWLGPDLLLVGRGYRTTQAGIDQLASMLPDVKVVPVPLPHWKGPGDVFHLMSILSPLAQDLLLVYSPLLPVPFREMLLDRGFRLVEVPEAEFESQGCNVLSVAPRVSVVLDGNPETRRRIEAEGVEVHSYVGPEISLKGCGGPTCLTRPLERDTE
jgi:N-dimethylarginine dimethylaminohydrolase